MQIKTCSEDDIFQAVIYKQLFFEQSFYEQSFDEQSFNEQSFLKKFTPPLTLSIISTLQTKKDSTI
jgi:hypothetical protein